MTVRPVAATHSHLLDETVAALMNVWSTGGTRKPDPSNAGGSSNT